MDDKQALTAELAEDVSKHLASLSNDRRRMMLNWLQAHYKHAAPISETTLKDCLKTWFSDLEADGILCEHQLILSEIDWWRELDERSLAAIMAAG